MTTTLPPHDPAHTATGTTDEPFREDAGPTISRAGWGAIAVMAIVQAADMALAKGTFDHIQTDAQWVSWMIAAAVGLGSSFVWFQTGKEARKAQLRGERTTVWFWVFLALAVGVGLALVGIRIAQPLLSEEDFSWAELLVSGFLFVVYLASGVKILRTSYEMSNPKLKKLKAFEKKIRKVEPQLVALEGELTRIARDHADHQERIKTLEGDLTASKTKAEANKAELMARSRLKIAAILHEIESTGVYRQATWPGASEPVHDEPQASGPEAA